MDKAPKNTSSFVSRNLVTIVIVPAIIALHFGWNAMQSNRSLVSEEEQIDLPVVTFAKYVFKKINGTDTTSTPQVSAAKTQNP